MSNLDNILNQILKDAKSESDQIIQEAEEKKNKEIEKIIVEAKNEKSAIIQKAEIESQNLIEKIVNSATLRARDEELSAKQTVVDRVIEKTKAGLEKIDEETYVSILKSALKDANISEDATISVQENMVDAFNKLGLPYKLSEDYVKSGFKFYDGKSIINNDFSKIVDSKRQDLESFIVQNLFEE